jgi:1-acyl-sn-glycerol-3-phosphate acyltransferase|nr:1-acyl-sn-glycerol-3-phosphate acyltransferase [Kofleriaceae bacterium]
MVRKTLVAAFRGVMRLYFRDIERVGAAPTASTRGRVFVANHYNALIDPILVLTDAACEISPIAKSTLWNIPGLKWLLDRAGAVPIVRRKDAPDKDASSNDAMFDKIAGHLAGGGNILIFPEGTSHSEPHLAPLRSGAARMLAAAQQAGADATYQAVGLEFDARDDFRSRALILWGPVRRFDDLGGDVEARVRAATDQMDADLRELLVEGDTHDERTLVARVAEMLANDAGDGSLEGWNTIGRQVELAGKTLRGLGADVVAQVAERVNAYYAELERLGVRDAQVTDAVSAPPAGGHPGDGHDAGARRLRRLRRIALAPLALSGIALYALPYFIPRLVARKTDHDSVSTVKLGVALLVYPVWMAGLVGASLALLPPPLSFGAAAISVASPFAALDWLDAYWARDHHTPTAGELAALARLRVSARTAIDDARARLANAS